MLRGAGKDFCVGRAGMGSRPRPSPTRYERRAFSRRGVRLLWRDAQLPRSRSSPWCRAARSASAAPSRRPATSRSRATRRCSQVPEMAHNILPTMVMSSFVDRVPRKAMSYLVYSRSRSAPERALVFGIVSDVVPAAKLDDAVDDAVRRDPEGAAAGDPRRQGIRQDRARHGGVRRRRIRPQPARHHQFIARDAPEALAPIDSI